MLTSAHGPTYKWSYNFIVTLRNEKKKSFRLYQKHKFIQFFDAFIAEILCLNFADDGIVEALDFFLIRWWCILSSSRKYSKKHYEKKFTKLV